MSLEVAHVVPRAHGSPEEVEPGVKDALEQRDGAGCSTMDTGCRLVQRSHWSCGTGLPAHSPVTAGEEVALRLGDGEMTLWSLFSEAVTMPGCPKPANTLGGEKLAWVLPSCTARRHLAFAAFYVPGQSTGLLEWVWGEGSDQHCPRHAPTVPP